MQKIELIKVRVDLTNSNTFPKGFVDIGALNLVTESQILVHEGEDDLEWEMLNKSSPKPPIENMWDNFFLRESGVSEDFMNERGSQEQGDRESL